MNQSLASPHSKLRAIGQRIIRITIIFILLIVVSLIGGLVYQSISEANDLQRYQPPGQLVSAGNFRLHLYCSGEGSPTVILESGLGGPLLQWALVQPEIAKTTRVCSYDRAGLGWSDAASTPRTAQQIVGELHTLLSAAHVPPPYVLVGHSFGGFVVRLYTHQYPQDVVGVVLVAGGNEHDNTEMPSEYQLIERSNQQTNGLLTVLTRFGITRILGNAGALSDFTNILRNYPPDLRAEMMAISFYRPQYWSTSADELSALNETRSEMAAAGSLGNLPLVVLSGAPDVSRLPLSFPVQKIKDVSRALQDELANLSSNSQHIICDTCDHYIPMTDPQKVIDAINLVLKQVQP